jgi:hypothetical protein
MGSNPGQVQILSFMQPPCSYFTLHKELFTKVLYFPKNYYHTSLHGTVATGACVDPTSQLCSPVMLVLPIAENLTQNNSEL